MKLDCSLELGSGFSCADQVGGYEDFLPGKLEPTVRDHSGKARILMVILESGHLTVSGGQFLWGGDLIKGN